MNLVRIYCGVSFFGGDVHLLIVVSSRRVFFGWWLLFWWKEHIVLFFSRFDHEVHALHLAFFGLEVLAIDEACAVGTWGVPHKWWLNHVHAIRSQHWHWLHVPSICLLSLVENLREWFLKPYLPLSTVCWEYGERLTSKRIHRSVGTWVVYVIQIEWLDLRFQHSIVHDSNLATLIWVVASSWIIIEHLHNIISALSREHTESFPIRSIKVLALALIVRSDPPVPYCCWNCHKEHDWPHDECHEWLRNIHHRLNNWIRHRGWRILIVHFWELRQRGIAHFRFL